jgi:hypothetical protein
MTALKEAYIKIAFEELDKLKKQIRESNSILDEDIRTTQINILQKEKAKLEKEINEIIIDKE